jgi:hypothetical protein
MTISDPEARAEIAAEWSAVRLQQVRLQTYIGASMLTGGMVVAQITDDIYALFLPFAYSVLEHVLEQARDEGRFSCKTSMIGNLMSASKESISWQNFDAVDAGRRTRNDLTHRRIVPSTSATFKAMDAIEAELIGWQLIDGPIQHEYQVSIS